METTGYRWQIHPTRQNAQPGAAAALLQPGKLAVPQDRWSREPMGNSEFANGI